MFKETDCSGNTGYELRYYPALSLHILRSPLLDRYYAETLPPKHHEMIAEVGNSINLYGMRNPLTVEWFDPYNDKINAAPDWAVRIGNNRLVALIIMGEVTAPALVIVPEGVTGPAGTYETVSVDAALTLFDAAHPWWHSYILRDLKPDLVPRCA